MSIESSSNKYQIDLVKRRVYFLGTEIKIRPKSFELLQLFIENPEEIISKDRMLSTIWDDVNVDEQVIFQSIKELRKAFSTIDAIKTFPRKGYLWIADVSIINDKMQLNEDSTLSSNFSSQQFKKNKKINFLSLLSAALILLFLGVISFILPDDASKEGESSQIEGSIIVLPIKEHINDRDHKWVRIGAMDQLIQQIPSAKNYGVMQVDDVLDIMKRANIPLKNFVADDIGKIFVVSGAALIIEAELTGTPGDYQLIYTLRRRHSIDRGVLITADIHGVIDQLAEIVATKLGTSTATLNSHQNNLANQLLAQALDKKLIDDYLGTEQYLKSLLELEPSNLKAKRLLAEVSVYLKKTQQIKDIVSSVEQISDDDNDIVNSNIWQREYGRLKFWQGLNELQFGHTDNALRVLEQASVVSHKVKDWLYMGYLAEVKGNLYRFTNQYNLANEQYHLAIGNHQIIKCPYGEVNNLLNLAETAFLQKKYESAKNNSTKALTIAKQRDLGDLVRRSNLIIEKYQAVYKQ